MMLSAPLAALRLGDDLLHVLGREELALLDVDRLAGARDRLDEIGLPAQERRRLQHVDDRRDVGDLVARRARRSAPARRSAASPRPGCAGPRPCPGRETTRPSCGWPCRSDDLKMNGMPSARADLLAACRRRRSAAAATRRRRARRSGTAARRGRRRSRRASSDGPRQIDATSSATASARAVRVRSPVLLVERRPDEADEQRMAARAGST